MATKDLAERLREIRERAEKATPGPWRAHLDGNYGEVKQAINPWSDIAIAASVYPEGAWGLAIEDAAFIAHAREDIPWLLDCLSEVESGSEGVTDEDAEMALADEAGIFAAGQIPPINRADVYEAFYAGARFFQRLTAPRLASAAKAEARVSGLKCEIRELEGHLRTHGCSLDQYCDGTPSSERAEEGGK